MFRHVIHRLPKALYLAAIIAVLAGYVPLTALDHLHLHLDHGEHFAHDHAHVGQHHHHHGSPDHDREDDDTDDDSRPVSAVLSLGDTAQMVQGPIAATVQASAVTTATAVAPEIRTDAPLHPSWSSRAPPA